MRSSSRLKRIGMVVLILSCWKAGDPVCDFFNSIVFINRYADV